MAASSDRERFRFLEGLPPRDNTYGGNSLADYQCTPTDTLDDIVKFWRIRGVVARIITAACELAAGCENSDFSITSTKAWNFLICLVRVIYDARVSDLHADPGAYGIGLVAKWHYDLSLSEVGTDVELLREVACANPDDQVLQILVQSFCEVLSMHHSPEVNIWRVIGNVFLENDNVFPRIYVAE